MIPRSVSLIAVALVAVVLAVAAPPARADDDDDHDLARDLYVQGEILALPRILHLIAERVPGEVIAVDLVRAGERWVYRLQIVTSDGRRLRIDVDAARAALIDNAAGHE
jgi:uncharacterized membrane protein YkoI